MEFVTIQSQTTKNSILLQSDHKNKTLKFRFGYTKENKPHLEKKPLDWNCSSSRYTDTRIHQQKKAKRNVKKPKLYSKNTLPVEPERDRERKRRLDRNKENIKKRVKLSLSLSTLITNTSSADVTPLLAVLFTLSNLISEPVPVYFNQF